jgi:hypothetical protein
MPDETVEFENGTITTHWLETLLEKYEEEDIEGTGNAVIAGSYELADDGFSDNDCVLRKSDGHVATKLHDDVLISTTELREKLEEARSKPFEEYIKEADWFHSFDSFVEVFDDYNGKGAVVRFPFTITKVQTSGIRDDEGVSLKKMWSADGDILAKIADER